MTTATQVQLRRDTAANIDAKTPAAGEPAWDTTNNRLRIGDNATAGGIPMVMAKDMQTSVFTYYTQGGTANAWTVTMVPDPGTAPEGTEIRVKCATANTGAFTINQNGHGAVSVKKKSGGALVDPASGDTFVGAQYTFRKGPTYWEIINEIDAGGGLVSVSQGNLNTSLGSISATCSGAGSGSIGFDLLDQIGTLPGGEYAFGFESKISNASSKGFVVIGNASTSYVRTAYGTTDGGTGRTITVQERYVTASPPFDLGDGPLAGFMFVRVNKAGEIVGSYIADVPPWAYNGPTKIRADYIDRMGRKFRRVHKRRSLDEVMGGAPHEIIWEEITQAIKNADMHLIPHPFQGLEHPDETIVLLNPRDDRLHDIMQHHHHGGHHEVLDALHSGKIYADLDSDLLHTMKGPPGVGIARLGYKYTRR